MQRSTCAPYAKAPIHVEKHTELCAHAHRHHPLDIRHPSPSYLDGLVQIEVHKDMRAHAHPHPHHPRHPHYIHTHSYLNGLSVSLEPRLSLRWLANMSLVTKIAMLPLHT